eukprot:14176327-Alexandrium_andersonii.AAC.1
MWPTGAQRRRRRRCSARGGSTARGTCARGAALRTARATPEPRRAGALARGAQQGPCKKGASGVSY